MSTQVLIWPRIVPALQESLDDIRYKLAPDPDRPGKLIVKVADASDDTGTKQTVVVQTGIARLAIGA